MSVSLTCLETISFQDQLDLMQVTIPEAKARLSQPIETVANGGEVVIARRRQPVARLVATKPAKRNRIGALAGRHFRMGSRFDNPKATKQLVNGFDILKR
jgi:antitoxin (DNA-binding transcriptional repressor) of toxin-antitoxin stability system